jgi:hypothetical protein
MSWVLILIFKINCALFEISITDISIFQNGCDGGYPMIA